MIVPSKSNKAAICDPGSDARTSSRCGCGLGTPVSPPTAILPFYLGTVAVKMAFINGGGSQLFAVKNAVCTREGGSPSSAGAILSRQEMGPRLRGDTRPL